MFSKNQAVSQNCNRKKRFGLVSCKSSTAKYYSKIIRTTFTIITSERFFFQCTFLGYWTVSWVLGLLVHRCAWYFIFRFIITWSNSTTLKLKNKFFFLISWQKKKKCQNSKLRKVQKHPHLKIWKRNANNINRFCTGVYRVVVGFNFLLYVCFIPT